jgi:phosphopantothenoylcysteine decarboxylase/phosphopantothenate--cysteine ligase
MHKPPLMAGPRILLIVGGGIAAYKACELVRLIRKDGGEVTCVLTAAGVQFVTPMSLAALSENIVHTTLWDLTAESEMGHIQLSRAADLVVVCPATADLLAKMAAGIADDLATTLLLATDKPVLAAPAMNVRMWEHAATVRNVARLRQDGVHVIEPAEGAMACGEFGPGRLREPQAIWDAIAGVLGTRTHAARPARFDLAPEIEPLASALPASPVFAGLEGKDQRSKALDGQPDFSAAAHRPLYDRHVLVTAGPTHEPIDPVRYIANRSSGKQGFAIAAAAAAAGARVTLVAGPVSLPTPPGVDRVDVETAREMADAVAEALPADAAVMVAAVADWRCQDPASEKLKKRGSAPPTLALTENPDILATLAAGPHRPKLVIGFAAETENVIANAQAKLKRKAADLIVANDVSSANGESVLGGEHNRVHIITESGVESWDNLLKDEVAARLVSRIGDALG